MTLAISHNPGMRKSYAKIPHLLETPNLIQIQQESYRWVCDPSLGGGLKELFDEVSPIKDFTGNRYELHFPSYGFGGSAEMPQFEDEGSFWEYMWAAAKYSEQECYERDVTYAVPLKVKVQLVIKETGEIKEQDLFMGDFPLMTTKGTFIINGAQRVVVSQLVRSPGVYFTLDEDPATGRKLCSAKLIPNRGAWLEFETSNHDLITVKVDRKRKIPATTLIRAISDAEHSYGTDEELMALFADVDTNPDHPYIMSTIERETTVKSVEEALIDLYKRLRPGDPPTLENARGLINALFFNPRRYDLGKVGRYKLSKRLGLGQPSTQKILAKEDMVAILRQVIMLNNGLDEPDDIDHLGNRRVRAVGELLQNQIRIGLLRMERVVRERMSLLPADTATPSTLVNSRPVVAAIREFFGSSQLSQFMDQTNPLAELTHKRRLSALGPGGLSRERAGFDVRDVHFSHYGRICPIETPEGPNIGLIGSLATYARVNEYGFIETPYRRVIRELSNNSPDLLGKTVAEDVTNAARQVVAEAGTVITADIARRLSRLARRQIKIKPFVSQEINYLSADEEENYIIAQANTLLDENSEFIEGKVEVRHGKKFLLESPDKVSFMDVSPRQIVSVTTSLIPFLEHDDANRALMGSNMQRQAVPLILPQSPLIATGMEREAARDSGQVFFVPSDGEVTSVSASEIVVRYDEGREQSFPLTKFTRSNQGTCINQRPVVSKGDRVRRGQVLADGSSTEGGELALGQNVLCAFVSWEGYNFEDAIVISESLVREDRFTSIHIEKYEVEARDTKLGPEEITRDIPNIGEESLRHLDEFGIIRVGAEVGSGDILVGKITPKGERGLTAEEKLLRAIFGEKAREVKDTSLRVPHGEYGKVIDVSVLVRDDDHDLPPGVNQMVRVFVAQMRKICEGDKMAGRHGNKGVIARIMPAEDMPFLPDGRPVDIILSPLGVPSRMNIGQLQETHLGWAAKTLGFKALSPVFDGADDASIEDALARAWIARKAGAIVWGHNGEDTIQLEKAKSWLDERGYDGEKVFSEEVIGEARQTSLRLWLEEEVGIDASALSAEEVNRVVEDLYREKGMSPPTFGKTLLYDGRSGEPLDQPVTVGYMYMMKLIHLVEDKIHARSTGPYSLITQQPLGGKAQFGGQRFGEMEVWALEAYGAAHNLQEMLTVKSDDVVGRVKTYEAIVNGEDIVATGVPESFKVLVKELQSLGLAIEVLNEDEERVTYLMESAAEAPRLGINLAGFEERE
ncbi:MAG: DNA-directed RNA polymerase subunit beta [Dehalococcoidia bacterium]|nr:MAG: DNA-directed RNA polymerase subunit beta [Dehalococcoidia bacterium]